MAQAGDSPFNRFMALLVSGTVLATLAAFSVWPAASALPDPALASVFGGQASVAPKARPVSWPVAIDEVLLAASQSPAKNGRVRDQDPTAPYKINIYQDADRATANRAKVDLDRDGRWDIKVEFPERGVVQLKHAPNDDDVHNQRYRFTTDGWDAPN